MYSTKMINTGGRSGEVHNPDRTFELNIAAPGKRVENATNPEQLFAAGFSACFNSALELIKQQKISLGLLLSVHKFPFIQKVKRALS